MRIAVASGKGGTGKTTVATNLAYVASGNGERVAYLDCDVEEPNGHIFLKPVIERVTPAGRVVPEVDRDACTLCGKCGEICQYSAIVQVKQKVLVFAELCHGCGGCYHVCPAGAITEVMRSSGTVERGKAGAVTFLHGILNVGEMMSPVVISAVRTEVPDVDLEVIDAPPGTSCPVITSVRGCDFVVLVTEPTPFGLHDLRLAVDMVHALDLPFGVVVNRADIGDNSVLEYCHEESIEILAAIRHDRRIAEAYSKGILLCTALPEYVPVFAALMRKARQGARRFRAAGGAL